VKKVKKVLVLMSTYNGSMYLKEQIDSILNQKNIEVSLLIRDDGSTDKTLDILSSYIEYDNIKVVFGKNLGVEKSYRELVKQSKKFNVDYFAFSDQDDVWLSEKLIRAISLLEKENNINKPIAYCSDLNVVDSTLNHLFFAKDRNRLKFNKYTTLVQNIATGCTMVFNTEARDIFLGYEPKNTTLHDYWLMLLCIFLGKVVYDDQAFILYRQHENNVIGISGTSYGKWKKKLATLKKLKEHPRENRAIDLLNGFSEQLSEEDIEMISIVANYRSNIKNKIKFLINRDIRMLSKQKNLYLKIRILLNSV